MTRRDDLDPARGMVWPSLIGVVLWIVVVAVARVIYR